MLAACVIAGAILVNDSAFGRYGWLLGGVLGFVAFVLAAFAFAAVLDFGFGGVPRLPVCRRGCCRADDYESQEFRDGYVRVSRCGERYARRGRRFVIVNDDGSVTPYLRWRAFRGWFPE